MTDVVAYSEAQTVELLTAVIEADGSTRIAKRRLGERGTDIPESELRATVAQHQGMYQALAAERARAQEDAIAQTLRETAALSQKVTRAFLEELADQIDEEGIAPDLRRQLPQTIQALAKVTQTSVDKLMVMTGRPQDGGSGDPMEGARALVEMGILVPRERPTVDAEGTADEG